MRNPASKFVRNRIKALPLNAQNREYIGDLLDIEHWILHGADGMAGNMHYGGLADHHPEEYDAIERELRPRDFARRKREEAEKARRDKAWRRRELAEHRRENVEIAAMWRRVKGSE